LFNPGFERLLNKCRRQACVVGVDKEDQGSDNNLSAKVHRTAMVRRQLVTKDYSFSTDTSVALIIAKTVSPSLRFIRLTEPVVIIDVTSPAAVRITSSDTTLSETIFSIVPGKRLLILVLMVDSFHSWLKFEIQKPLDFYGGALIIKRLPKN
jgi:hypothetical protein